MSILARHAVPRLFLDFRHATTADALIQTLCRAVLLTPAQVSAADPSLWVQLVLDLQTVLQVGGHAIHDGIDLSSAAFVQSNHTASASKSTNVINVTEPRLKSLLDQVVALNLSMTAEDLIATAPHVISSRPLPPHSDVRTHTVIIQRLQHWLLAALDDRGATPSHHAVLLVAHLSTPPRVFAHTHRQWLVSVDHLRQRTLQLQTWYRHISHPDSTLPNQDTWSDVQRQALVRSLFVEQRRITHELERLQLMCAFFFHLFSSFIIFRCNSK